MREIRRRTKQALLSSAPDMVRETFRAFAQEVMDAEVEAARGAG
jgi:hypothetical protein